MPQQMYSVEQVADRLGLHVRTVRKYVRDGRLGAVRIGKQYRIAPEDLEAFTGRPDSALGRQPARRHVEASSIVQIDAIDAEEASRLSNLLMGAVKGRGGGDQPLRVETIYDEERARLKIVVVAGLDAAAGLFQLISVWTESGARADT